MATVQDLIDIYTAAGLPVPSRWTADPSAPVTDQQVADIQARAAELTGTSGGTSTGGETGGSSTTTGGSAGQTTGTSGGTSGGNVGDLTVQIEALFNKYGVPVNLQGDGTTVDPTQRLVDLAQQVIDGTRTLADIEASIRYIGYTQGINQPGGGGGAAGPTAGTGEGGQWTVEDLMAIFDSYGVPYDVHASGATENPDVRLQRLVDELNSGQRTIQDVTSNIARIADIMGFTPGGPTQNAVIAPGGSLYAVQSPDGTTTYHVVYEWEGMSLSYEIGDITDLNALFPDPSKVFTATFTVNQAQWDQSGILGVGSIDERLGDATPIAVELNRTLSAYGLESMPAWLRDDPQATTIAANAALEGWSAGRTLRELAKTQGFRDRFTAWQWALEQAGGDELAAMTLYTQRENQLRNALSTYRGPNANLTPTYLGDLLERGWTVQAITPILAAEQTVRADPQLLVDVNRLLEADGQNPLGPVGLTALIAAGQQSQAQLDQMLADVDMTELLGGNEPTRVFDLVNDAMTLSALEDQGLVGLSLDFVRQLRNQTGGVLDREQVDQWAQTAAVNVLRFGPDVYKGRYGLTEEALIAQATGRPSPDGQSSAQVLETMNKIIRERQQAAQGFDQFSGFISDSGRLVIPGLGGA